MKGHPELDKDVLACADSGGFRQNGRGYNPNVALHDVSLLSWIQVDSMGFILCSYISRSGRMCRKYLQR
jgi:hypothetical protein